MGKGVDCQILKDKFPVCNMLHPYSGPLYCPPPFWQLAGGSFPPLAVNLKKNADTKQYFVNWKKSRSGSLCSCWLSSRNELPVLLRTMVVRWASCHSATVCIGISRQIHIQSQDHGITSTICWYSRCTLSWRWLYWRMLPWSPARNCRHSMPKKKKKVTSTLRTF